VSITIVITKPVIVVYSIFFHNIHPFHKCRFKEDDLVVAIKIFIIWPKEGIFKVKPMENGQGWMDDPIPMTLTIKASSLSCRCNTL
jgi:hypothetical protein